MAHGEPLADGDRHPWLTSIRDWISLQAEAGHSVVVTCSALKRSYRDILRGARADVRFVQLMAGQDVVRSRMTERSGHFMPSSLLASQFAALELRNP
jgi:gluconokinase